MQTIQRGRFFKTKLLLSSFALFAGFIVTAGMIGALSTADTSVQQSVETSEQSSLLIPINASTSESSAESSEKLAGETGSENGAIPASSGSDEAISSPAAKLE